jgi:hypothetical protein
MGDEIQPPREFLEEVAALRLPATTDQRLQVLMDRNNDGALSEDERQEMESVVAMSESISLVRAKALRMLGRKPCSPCPR